MSYCLVIEGTEGARRILRGTIPRRGEWINLLLESDWSWLPVLEVAHAFSKEEKPAEGENSFDSLHKKSESLVFTSLAVSVKAEARSKDESFKLILPPTRWPFGGQVDEDHPRMKTLDQN